MGEIFLLSAVFLAHISEHLPVHHLLHGFEVVKSFHVCGWKPVFVGVIFGGQGRRKEEGRERGRRRKIINIVCFIIFFASAAPTMPTLDGRLLNDQISEMQCHRCCLTGLRARRPVPVRAFFAADINET